MGGRGTGGVNRVRFIEGGTGIAVGDANDLEVSEPMSTRTRAVSG
jgi:hypothetical protein